MKKIDIIDRPFSHTQPLRQRIVKMDFNQPKTRAEKGKGKGAKTREVFNQKTIRLKEAAMAKGVERAVAAAATTGGKKKH